MIMDLDFQAADLLASGIHDAKNRLFEIGVHALGGEMDSEHIQTLVLEVASRLDRTLTAYRLMNRERIGTMLPAYVPALVQDVVVRARPPGGVRISTDVRVDTEWPLSRSLIEETLVNATQNAARFAKSAIEVRALQREGMLVFEVNDDGPGFHADAESDHGIGLFIAQRVAQLHNHLGSDGKARQGRLALSNGGALGGALFSLELP